MAPAARRAFLWCVVGLVVAVPLGFAAASPLLQWRDPVYILAGFAGVCAMALMLVQPMLASGGLGGAKGRRMHRWVGTGLVALVVIHIGGLWITSPPDVIDVFLLRSPTPFSIWGLIALLALIGAALLVVLRRTLRWRPATWRRTHAVLVTCTVSGTVVHALLIEGTMEDLSKIALSVAVVAALIWALARLGTFSRRYKTS